MQAETHPGGEKKDENIKPYHPDISLTTLSDGFLTLFRSFGLNTSLFVRARGDRADVICVAVISSAIQIGALTVDLPRSS